MTIPISEDHPLRRMFRTLCRKNLAGVAHLRPPEVADYAGELLVRFVHMDEIRWLRDAAGRQLEDVGEMLLESDRHRTEAIPYPEREVRRHVGDFTLFFLGMFPEWAARRPTTRLPGPYVDWASEGRHSYKIVSEFRFPPFEQEAPLFAALSDNFDDCVTGLNLVRDDLRQLADPRYAWLREALD